MSETKFIPPEAQTSKETNKKELIRQLLLPEMKKIILGIIYKFKLGTAEAEDISQQVLLKAYKAIEEGKFEEKEAKLKSWVYRITQNECITFFRKAQMMSKNGMTSTEVKDYMAVSNLPTGEEALEIKTRNEKLQSLLSYLTPKERKVMDLYLQGYSQEEIGEKLGINKSTAATTVFRAKKIMLGLLEEEKQKEDKL